MEINELKLFKFSHIFASYVKMSPNVISKVVEDYRIDSYSDDVLLEVFVKFYLRQHNIKHPEIFTKKEWVVLILFFGIGMKLAKIARMIDCSKNQAKYYFFSGKQKLNMMELQS